MGFDQVSDMSKNIYERLQDKLMKSKILYTIRVETVTPILIGGYDGRCYHGNKLGFEGLRVSSIKGIWRWWARALIAAAMMRKHNSYLTLDIADSLIAKIFGSTKISSKYAIMIFPRKFKMENYELIIENNKPVKQYNTISRIKLISQRKNLRREYAIKPHAQFEIAIYRNRNSKQNEDEFIIWSLITSLLFDGIGKACSRGFGKVKILKVLGDNVEDLNTLLQKLYSSENIENIEKYLKDIINRATEKAENIIDLLKNEHSELGRLADKPLIEIPLIEDKLMIIEIPNKPFNKPADVIKAISNATLKLYHKMLKYLKQNNERQARQHAMSESGRDVHTWFLGMPRAQEPAIIPDSNKQNELKQKLRKELYSLRENGFTFSGEKERKLLEKIKLEKEKIRIPTGYYYMGEYKKDLKLRRRSPIRFTVIKTDDSNYYIIIYAFKTYDWEYILSLLIHIGAYYKKIWVKEKGKSKLKIVDVESFTITPIRNVDIDNTLLNLLSSVKEIIERFEVRTQ